MWPPTILASNDFIPVAAAVVGAIAVLILFVELSVRARRKQRLIDDIPTCKTAGVFIGLVEVKGTAESEEPLTSFLAEQECVHYTYTVSEQWRRMVTETYTDSKGRTQTRTRMKTGWDTVAHGSLSTKFYLQDDTGLLQIQPGGAEIEGSQIFSRTCSAADPLYYGKGPTSSVFGSTGTRSFVEYGIPLHQRIYVMGSSRLRKDVVAPEIAKDRHAPMFLISVKSEQQKSSGYQFRFWGWFIAGLVIFAGAPLGIAVSAERPVPWLVCLLGGLIFSGCWSARWVVMVYNSLLALKNRVEQAWKNVDVQLKRRHDLIPRLVEVVQGYKEHEAELHEHLVMLRNEAQVAIGDAATACTPTVMALKEAYPDLEANTLFQNLQDELTRTEQKIALARGYYNDIVAENNERVERIPDRFFRGLARMGRRRYYEAQNFERAPVKVDLVNTDEASEETTSSEA
ncbi:MAG: LemA family protein [Planctomycetota bacterium]|nr:LemA family protein [Planctomycetota bacterium]